MRRALIIVASVMALVACQDKGYSAQDYADAAKDDEKPATTTPLESQDVMPSSNAEYLGLFEAKGIHLGMARSDVAATLASRNFFIPPEGGSPMTEMVAQLPSYAGTDTAYIDTAQCRAEFERHRNLTRDEANSMSNMRYRGCDLSIRLFYDADDAVVAFYVTPAGFGLERTDLRQFAEAVATNLPTGDLTPESQSINTLGQSGVCTNFVGQAAAGERINVSDCGFMRMQVQQSASASGDFQ